MAKKTSSKKNTTVKGAKNALIKTKGTTTILESRKAVKNENKEIVTKAQYSIKATFKPATVKTVECVVFSSNGCYAVATRSGKGGITLTARPVNTAGMEVDDAEFKTNKNKACFLSLKKYLERKLKLDTMKWSTMVEKWCVKEEKEEKENK